MLFSKNRLPLLRSLPQGRNPDSVLAEIAAINARIDTSGSFSKAIRGA
jgi:hypothetical protein